ncbi:MAG: alkaline phosphatase family protein [Rhodocyclaceae bacterium]|nr:alkaline phosphatase family protein [Rhodocyclaceae bacterium]MBX3677920.1 alkaline phosphatase family protein [Rhodocyclaceae bacterium]MCB1890914.1 alkaline phosphatase family protein [Rhodocyclaceae bacterium]MCP5295974.1 alkaline phosphatase family protein [Zoogloeaceae bacterium]
MIRPDYAGGSIVNLMRTLGDACGARQPLPYAPLRNLKVSLLGTARNIVLLVIDGLGYDYLLRHGAGGALHRHLHSRLTSVFPSTTASAVTTYLSGLAPQQHALTGWHMYFSELDAIAAVLPLRPRGAGLFDALPGALPLQLFGHAPFVDRIARRATIVSPQSIAGSDFNLYHSGRAAVRGYKTLTELFGQVEARLRASTAPAYLYAYYAELDTLAHIHGVGSDQLAAQFALLDAAFGNFLAAIADTDTVVLACADHGFIDSPPERQIELAQHPDLAATLARPLCGERRVVYCYVKPDKETRFVDYVQDVLGECADLFSGSELIAQGWFGPGEADPRLAARIGDYVLLMRENWTLRDWVEGEKRYKQLGVHAGVSADEMHVPLILARCGA